MALTNTDKYKSEQRKERILYLYYSEESHITTIQESVDFFRDLSIFPVTLFNLAKHRQNNVFGLELPKALNLESFHVLIIHNTVAYNSDNLWSIDNHLKNRLKKFKGVKVLFKQDENYRFREIDAYIQEYNIDLVLTCLPESEIHKVYPEVSKKNSTKFLRMLTGYVTPTLRNINPINKEIDIGYRGSIQPLDFGRLAYEKRKIGYDVYQLTKDNELRLDISSKWEDRIAGYKWLEFLAKCKVTLGAESGASLFDLDGSLASRCEKAEAELGPYREDADYAEAYLSYLSDLEGNVYYNQISPRHFEAIATRTLQWLYPGNYSNILVPYRHYIPLERDYSNLDECVKFLNNDKLRQEITDCAYNEIILNKKYWIETFVEDLDNEILLLLEKKGIQLIPEFSSDVRASNILMICANEPHIDPRLEWIANCAPSNMTFHTLGLSPPSIEDKFNLSEKGFLSISKSRVPYQSFRLHHWHKLFHDSELGLLILREIQYFDYLLKLNIYQLSELTGIPLKSERINYFRWYLTYYLDSCSTLMDKMLTFRGIHLIIAVDLDALLPALIAKAIYNIPVVYDSHEFWPEADMYATKEEIIFWERFEGKLVKHTDYAQTVSSGIAKIASERYKYDFKVLPNAEPISNFNRKKDIDLNAGINIQDKIVFTFQGGFADGRGLDTLIRNWSKVTSNAILLLRGPDNPYKDYLIDMAEKVGLLNGTIYFPDPVSESDLIYAASKAHVGIVPYPIQNNAYDHCCPNKLSQYMAAKVAILANNTFFVTDIVEKANAGIVVDFSMTDKFVEAVNLLTNDEKLRNQFAHNAHSFHISEYNWQKVSGDFYNTIGILVSNAKSNFYMYSDVPTTTTLYNFDAEYNRFELTFRAAVKYVLLRNEKSSFFQILKSLLRPVLKCLPHNIQRLFVNPRL